MKIGLFTETKKKILKGVAIWVFSIVCLQYIFYKVAVNDLKDVALSVKVLIQNEINVSNPLLASNALLTLEKVGLIQCVKINIRYENETIPFFNTSYKNECKEEFISLKYLAFKSSYQAANNSHWDISFVRESTKTFYYSLMALRILISSIFILLFYFNTKELKLQNRLYKSNLEKERLRNKTNNAIAQATQMLAHDVRKPFTMIQGLIGTMKSSKDPIQMKEFVIDHLPEVNNALSSVNAMIADVMEIGSDNNLVNKESVSINSIIKKSLSETFMYTSESNVNIAYDLKHTHKIQGDYNKLIRVTSNIVANAVQAMRFDGDLWIRTKDIEWNQRSYLEVCIGNSNSYIDEQDLSILFDAFFTKDKKGGTGLGLAISKKYIKAHNGDIWCRSSKDKGTEFYYTLPSSTEVDKPVIDNPIRHSSEVSLHKEIKNTINNSSEVIPSQEISSLSSKIEGELKDLNIDLLKVVCVDDEAIYRHLVEGLIPEGSNLKNYVKIDTFSSAHAAIQYVSENPVDMILMDIDLGSPDISGFEACEKIRVNGYKNKICIHSNRGTFEFDKKARQSGADLMIPKPLSKIHFLRLLLSIVKERNVNKSFKLINNSKEKNISKTSSESLKETPHIIIVEDSKLILMGWKNAVKSVKQMHFKTPEAFFKDLENDASLLLNSLCVITDNDFDKFSETTGFQIAAKLKAINYKKPIYLSSNGTFSREEINKYFNKRVPKTSVEAWEMIQKDLELS